MSYDIIMSLLRSNMIIFREKTIKQIDGCDVFNVVDDGMMCFLSQVLMSHTHVTLELWMYCTVLYVSVPTPSNSFMSG